MVDHLLFLAMSVGDTIGFASLKCRSKSFTTDLLVSSIVSSTQVIVESIECNSGLVLGTFDISNNLTGGVSVMLQVQLMGIILH